MRMGAASAGRHRRRGQPRLCGTLHIEDANGHQLTVPLRGRASVLTADGTGLTGYGEVWAVHTSASAPEISLMISYGPDGVPERRESGLCEPGATIVLGGVRFTWRRSGCPGRGRPVSRATPGSRGRRPATFASRRPGSGSACRTWSASSPNPPVTSSPAG
jgi:hypothetical protein